MPIAGGSAGMGATPMRQRVLRHRRRRKVYHGGAEKSTATVI